MRLTRRGDGSHYDQVTWGFKANLSDVLAAIALAQLDKLEGHGEIRARQVALYDDGAGRRSRGSRRSRATPGTRMRCTSTSSGSTRRAPGPRATRTSARSPRS